MTTVRRIRFPVFWLFPVLCLLAGCELVAEDDAFSWQTVQEVFRRELQKVLGHAVIGSFLGSLAGFLVGLLAWQTYRRLAGFSGSDRRDPWHSRLIGLVLLFAGTVLGGWIGMLEGGKRGVRAAVYAGPIGQELLPQMGNAGADLLLRVDHFLQTGTRTDNDILSRFRAGTVRLDIERLQRRIEELETASAQRLADFVLEKIYEEHPHFRGQIQETLLSWIVPRYAEALVADDLPEMREEFDPQPFLDRLVEVAREGDGSAEMTRRQLSQFFVDQVVVPDVFANLEWRTLRTQRYLAYAYGAVIAAAFVLGLLVWVFRPACRNGGSAAQH